MTLCPACTWWSQPSGARGWACRYRRASDGKPRKLTVGSWPLIPLAEAREKARAALRTAAEGGDPAGDKRRRRETEDSRAFQAVLERFITRGCGQHRTQAETRRMLTREVLPYWRGRTVDSLTRADVTDVLYRITDRGSLVQANRVFGRLRRLFRWASETGAIEASPMASLRRPAVELERERVLSDDELRAVWRACDAIGWPFGRAMQLLILTAQRRDEVALAEWSEIDLDGAMWTIPGCRMKNGEAHVVPLAPAAIDMLQSAPKFAGCSYVLTARPPKPIAGFSKAKARIDALSGVTGWKFHDLRRTAATGMARLGVAPHVADRVLGHKQGTIRGVAKIYNRHAYLDERREALCRWAAFVEAMAKDTVVPLARRA